MTFIHAFNTDNLFTDDTLLYMRMANIVVGINKLNKDCPTCKHGW